MERFDMFTGAMIPLSSPLRVIHVIKRPPDFHLRLHSHNFYHVIFVTAGILEVILDGQSYFVHENQAVILPPSIPHSLHSKKGYSQIGVDILNQKEREELCSLICQIFPTGFSIVNMNMLPAKYEELIKSVRDLTRLNLLRLQNSAESLVLSFLEQATDSSNKNFRERFLDMVIQDECLNLTLSDMCRHLDLSKTHLERLVREDFGCGAIEYYHKLKFMKACFLLQNTDVPIRVISEQLKFYDESHFTRFFKKQCGQTPSQYRSNSRTPVTI